MSQHLANLPNLVIASGGTNSGTTPPGYLDDALALTIVAPAVLTTACNIQVSQDAGATFANLLLTDGTAVASITQGQARIIISAAIDSLRLSTVASTAATTTTFTISKVFLVS
jgi:hypothetical protein